MLTLKIPFQWLKENLRWGRGKVSCSEQGDLNSFSVFLAFPGRGFKPSTSLIQTPYGAKLPSSPKPCFFSLLWLNHWAKMNDFGIRAFRRQSTGGDAFSSVLPADRMCDERWPINRLQSTSSRCSEGRPSRSFVGRFAIAINGLAGPRPKQTGQIHWTVRRGPNGGGGFEFAKRTFGSGAW